MRSFIFLALIGLLAACGHVDTTKIRDVQAQPRRIFVIETSPAALKDLTAAMENRLAQRLNGCGVQTGFAHMPPHVFAPSLDSSEADARKAIAARQAAFQPDFVLTIADPYDYRVELIDEAAHKTAWSGRVEPATTFSFMMDPAAVGTDAADKIADQFNQDGILRNCPPVTPQGNI